MTLNADEHHQWIHNKLEVDSEDTNEDEIFENCDHYDKYGIYKQSGKDEFENNNKKAILSLRLSDDNMETKIYHDIVTFESMLLLLLIINLAMEVQRLMIYQITYDNNDNNDEKSIKIVLIMMSSTHVL